MSQLLKDLDNINWFMSEYAKERNWDNKTAYSFLVKEWSKYKSNKRVIGEDLIPHLRQYIEKHNPDLLEWFDGLAVLV